MKLVVVGCGVSGLSSAVAALESGLGSVEIWTRDLPAATVSSVAAAVWYPYRAYPQDKVLAWGRQSLTEFAALAARPGTGVFLREGLELFREEAPDPWWRGAVPGFRRATVDELPTGFVDGYAFRVPVIEMPVYLEWLQRRFEELGGRIEVHSLQSLDEALDSADAVVHCAGLGARELAADPEVYAVRGQVLRVEHRGPERFLIDDHGPGGVTYIVPRTSDCVLGGTAEEGVESIETVPETLRAIRERCIALEPALSDAAILEERAGLRPCRSAVRLGAERHSSGKLIVHNYGHGGAGVTLSWGCAREAVQLLRNLDRGGELIFDGPA